MPTIQEIGVRQLQGRLRHYPAIGRLIDADEPKLILLNEARELGAALSEFHPLVELLFGGNHRRRGRSLDRRIAALRLDERDRADFRRRILSPKRRAWRDSSAALTELFVGGSFALHGGETRFVSRSSTQTPDVRVSCGTTAMALEVASINVSDSDADAADELELDFHTVPEGARPDGLLKVHMRRWPGVRSLGRIVRPLGGGVAA